MAKNNVNGGVAQSDFVWPVRVYYEDTDAGGIVYYANYLRFFERARTEYLRTLGVQQDQLVESAGLQFVVRAVNVAYRAPARFNDQLSVSVSVERVRGASVDFMQNVVREGEDQVLVTASVKIACVHRDSGSPKPIPKLLREAMQGE